MLTQGPLLKVYVTFTAPILSPDRDITTVTAFHEQDEKPQNQYVFLFFPPH
jgi:hypothetical protein